MPEATELVETLHTFLQAAINEDKGIAWEQTVHKGRQNKSVMDYLTRVRELLEKVRLELEDAEVGGDSVQVLRDENIPFERGPTRRFVQLEVSCSLRGYQRCEHQGIDLTHQEVVIRGLRFNFFMVDGLVSSMTPPLMHDEAVLSVLQAEREAYERRVAEREGQERQRKLAEGRKMTLIQLALQKRGKRGRRHAA